MLLNRLKLINKVKTELLVISCLRPARPPWSHTSVMRECWLYQKASNLVVLFDESLSEYGFSGDCRLQISILSYRKISLVRKYVTVYEAQLIVAVRVTSKFDYTSATRY